MLKQVPVNLSQIGSNGLTTWTTGTATKTKMTWNDIRGWVTTYCTYVIYISQQMQTISWRYIIVSIGCCETFNRIANIAYGHRWYDSFIYNWYQTVVKWIRLNQNVCLLWLLLNAVSFSNVCSCILVILRLGSITTPDDSIKMIEMTSE